ncbi:hypothetical protein E4U42_003021 [Claviceps africana]|uniref:Phosphoribosylaminoimidazole-succinocarboxamide synthase n=1 Tax=Claviceps africana TaxID=83212 RepID=A0A8K0NJC4_9HYPO|nr:hypothetical protein E4U42_003021 [Claviceps africana]
MFAADDAARVNIFKDELSLAAGQVTPGVDNSPYIQYALDALTRDQEGSSGSQVRAGSPTPERYSESPPPQQRPRFMVKDPASLQSPRLGPASNKSHYAPIPHRLPAGLPESPSAENASFEGKGPALQPTRYPNPMAVGLGQWIPVGKDELQTIDPRGRTYQPLTFKPRIIRPLSMIFFMMLAVSMTVGLIVAAVYSHQYHGLTPYPGSIYSWQYFVFRILPQLLAGAILIYAQSIVIASLRILPFAALAGEDPQERYQALFRNLYPKTFLWPQWSGPWQFKAFSVATWLMNFTVPLQSALFTVINDDGKAEWRWATSSGVIWTLVALYIILLIATLILMIFWSDHWTGLAWDVRSIADLIPLLHRTNTMSSYRRKGLCGRNRDLKAELPERWFDRLGYWQMEDMTTGGIWHTIGISASPTIGAPEMPLEKQQQRQRPGNNTDRRGSWIDSFRGRPSNELSDDSQQTGSCALLDFEGGSYMPLSLRSLPLTAFVLVVASLVLALLIVSFLPQTRLENGFAPLVAVRPNSSAFSAANFLYSFLPAGLGMVLFLLFQSPDRALRIVQPWSDMGRLDGGLASRTILADYAACLPLEVTWRALCNGHWRVALLSLMSTLSIFIPILAGGLLMALTARSGQVRMFPSMPVFGVLVALLILYVACLGTLLPRRQQFRLPHSVETIASTISFCTAEDLCADAAFRSVRSRADLLDRLGVGRPDRREESVWFFGVLAGRDEKRLSIRRMKRYTEKMTMTRFTNSMV